LGIIKGLPWSFRHKRGVLYPVYRGRIDFIWFFLEQQGYAGLILKKSMNLIWKM
jgi:hypothetical protein